METTCKPECECPCHCGGWDGAGTCKQPCEECDMKDDLTKQEMEQQDFVDNTIIDMVNELYKSLPQTNGKDIDYCDFDVSQQVARIRDIVWEMIEKHDPKAKEIELYAWLE